MPRFFQWGEVRPRRYNRYPDAHARIPPFLVFELCGIEPVTEVCRT